jgi:hypothetical protein
MQCPFCASEISPNAVTCEKCGAAQITQRSSTGVLAGWLGMVMAILWGMLAFPLIILPFTSYSLKGYPLTPIVIGAIIAAGLLWYSKSTVHNEWVRRD